MVFSNCDVLEEVEAFLEVEKEEVRKKTSRRRIYYATITERQMMDDLYYSFFECEDFKLKEGLWIEVVSSDYPMFGALWYSEKKKSVYIITEQEIRNRDIKIREADEYELVLMQEEALNSVIYCKTKQDELLKKLINQRIYFPNVEQKEITFLDANLDVQQRSAVRSCCSLKVEDLFHLIHGPPGTGKTTVITEIVRQLQKRGEKVLVTSHTNVAVDNALEKIVEASSFMVDEKSIIRLGNKTNVSKRLRDIVPVRSDETITLKTAQVVGATLSKVSMLKKLGKLSWQTPYFDCVIVDECSMATIPLTLIGVLCAKKFVLVGDHMQLPPITTPAAHKLIRKEWESLFRVLYDKYSNKHTLLDLQYRSHPTIMGFSSKCFYDDKIRSHKTCHSKILNISTVDRENIPGTINNKPMLYVDTSKVSISPPIGRVAVSTNPRDSKSYFNEYEAAVAVALWADFLEAGVNPNDICIITPFRQQHQTLTAAMREIAKRMDKANSVADWRLAASTVHKFQGKEKEVVIYCVTWNPDYPSQRLHVALQDFRALNVALTRAIKKLIVVGSLSEIEHDPHAALAQYLKDGMTVCCPKLEKSNPFLRLVIECFENRGKSQSQMPKMEGSISKSPASWIKKKPTPPTCSPPTPPKIKHEKTVPTSPTPAWAPKNIFILEKFMKENRTATDLQVAAETGFSLADIKKYRQKLKTKAFPINMQLRKQSHSSPQNRQEADLDAMIECPYCPSKVKKRNLDKHIKKVHNKQSNSKNIGVINKDVSGIQTQSSSKKPKPYNFSPYENRRTDYRSLYQDRD